MTNSKRTVAFTSCGGMLCIKCAEKAMPGVIMGERYIDKQCNTVERITVEHIRDNTLEIEPYCNACGIAITIPELPSIPNLLFNLTGKEECPLLTLIKGGKSDE